MTTQARVVETRVVENILMSSILELQKLGCKSSQAKSVFDILVYCLDQKNPFLATEQSKLKGVKAIL